VGGGEDNQAGNANGTDSEDLLADAAFATVAGGKGNSASGLNSMVGGGVDNLAYGIGATVGGGDLNRAIGGTSVVSGGLHNRAIGLGASVGGGNGNIAEGLEAVIAGGATNTASGTRSVVPGGFNNNAEGEHSFAAGHHAKALHDGTFVWSDATTEFQSTEANQFNVLASGGTRIFSNSPGSTGVQLAPGGNSWLAVSDRALKENFTRLDRRQLLERLAWLPITEWNLKSQDPNIRHVGPTAQDFYAAFGLGEDDRYIGTSDADGVALAAIQELYRLVQEQQQRIAALQARLEELQ
jgi:hypothetical protein